MLRAWKGTYVGWWKKEVRWTWDGYGRPLGSCMVGPGQDCDNLLLFQNRRSLQKWMKHMCCHILKSKHKNFISWQICVSVGHAVWDSLFGWPNVRISNKIQGAEGRHIWNGSVLERRVSELIRQGHLPHLPWVPEVFLPAKGNSGVSFTPTSLAPVLKFRHHQRSKI